MLRAFPSSHVPPGALQGQKGGRLGDVEAFPCPTFCLVPCVDKQGGRLGDTEAFPRPTFWCPMGTKGGGWGTLRPSLAPLSTQCPAGTKGGGGEVLGDAEAFLHPTFHLVPCGDRRGGGWGMLRPFLAPLSTHCPAGTNGGRLGDTEGLPSPLFLPGALWGQKGEVGGH